MLSSSRQPLQSIPFVAVVVARVDRHDSALLSSFIGLRIVVRLLLRVQRPTILSPEEVSYRHLERWAAPTN
jgi:hypothetical protein